MKLEFGPWLPDLPGFGNPGMTDAQNVIPALKGYQPFRAINPYSNALTARCQGAWSIKDNAGTSHAYAGDATKLYLLSGSTWSDASRLAGGAYTIAADLQWRFVKYGTLGIAVNGSDAPQSITLSSGTNFAALAGSPPTARHIAVVREFVVMGNITSAQNRVQWSASNNAIVWTTGTNEANQQDIPDGGIVQAIIGGEVGYIFQERQIVRMIRVPAPITFQFDVVEQNRGVLCPYSVVSVGGGVFYVGQDGIYFFNGVNSEPIGHEGQVDETFFRELNSDFYDRVSVAVDPIRKLVVMAYPTGGGGEPNKLLIWHWPTKRFTYSSQNCEILFSFFALGVTLEGLDAISTSIETLPNSLDASVYQGGNQSLAAFDSAHKLAFFDGTTLEAKMVTGEAQPNPNGRAQVQEVIPLIDTDAATVAIGVRESQSDAVSYGPECGQRSNGICPTRKSGKYLRGRVTVPAGTTWSYAQGIDVVKTVSDGVRGG